MKFKVETLASAPAASSRPRVRLTFVFVFPADGHEREAVAGLQQTGPGFSEAGHRRGAFRCVLNIGNE